MKYLIVGLGNIGAEYENTRHNIGFKALDALASASNASFVTNRLGDVTEVKHKGRTLILLKPSTFMNLSGKSVNYWMQEEKIPLSNVLIITDDIALDFGVLRLKPKGSDGGHNGLKSINQTLGTQEYCRIRFGVGNDFGRGQQVQYVLGEWSKDQQLDLPERLDQTAKMILAFTTTAVQRVMSDFNGK